MGGWKRIRQISHLLMARSRIALGYPARMNTADRKVLEEQILPALARDPTVTSLVFVGCDWYTMDYERLLPGVTVHTLDPDPRRCRYGAARHSLLALQDMETVFAPASLDAIVCNGVYGWGLDTRADCEQAFRACAACLRPGGWFVLGWNNVPRRDPAPLASVALDGFVARPFPAVGTALLEVIDSTDRHTYAFYRRA
ncbi:MAG: class I SAM-dependent methyltransferase [Caldimonas sp.]